MDIFTVPVLVLALVFSYLVGKWAEQKGLSLSLYFLLSLLLSPFIGALLVAVAKGDPTKAAARDGKKKCPDCAEWVEGEARVCRFCRHEFYKDAAAAASAAGELRAAGRPAESVGGYLGAGAAIALAVVVLVVIIWLLA